MLVHYGISPVVMAFFMRDVVVSCYSTTSESHDRLIFSAYERLRADIEVMFDYMNLKSLDSVVDRKKISIWKSAR